MSLKTSILIILKIEINKKIYRTYYTFIYNFHQLKCLSLIKTLHDRIIPFLNLENSRQFSISKFYQFKTFTTDSAIFFTTSLDYKNNSNVTLYNAISANMWDN